MTDEDILRKIESTRDREAVQLDLSYQGLTSLPPDIGRLVNLVSLDLSGNDLVSLPPEIGELSHLQQLDLRHNRLTRLPASIGYLASLIGLDLRDNRLSVLPAEMVALAQLTSLDLRENRFEIFPQVILGLSALEDLQLWSNPLMRFPIEVGALNRLKMLNLGRSAMQEIPVGIWSLTNLEHLIIDHTRISQIPSEIEALQNLEYVELHNNQLTTLPSQIGSLSRLITLILHHNALTHLPSEIGRLKQLRQLDLHQNHLVSLPNEITALQGLEKLDLSGNPLSIPPEILNKTTDPPTLLRYYLDHLEGQKYPLNEAKMVLVGQANVGKTSLVNRLVENFFNPLEFTTEGIDIRPWQIQVNDAPVQLNVWDFGGQEIMHATHQFFLTRRTLYVLVIDTRMSEDENRLEYWLKIIRSFGGESPVIVVGNKIDQAKLDIDRRGLRSKYPQIRAIVQTSCATGRGIDKLKARIAHEVTRLPHLRDMLLSTWFEVKRELEELDKDYIPYETYREMCEARGIEDIQSQRTLIGFLHDLGIVLNFQDDPRLEDTNILNPDWVTRGVYCILNDDRLMERRGLLERQDLIRILDPRTYPRHKHQFILDMMCKFELCFAFEGLEGERFLISDLLSKEAPVIGDWNDALAFQYHYNVLPSSVISRFIVRMHPYLYKTMYWRSGAVVADQGNRALVQADREDKRVYIWVRGPEQTRRVLLSIIRYHFDTIHKTIPGIRVEEKVALPDHPDIVVDYQYLLDLEAMGERSFVPPGLRQRVNVKRLLEGVDLRQAQRMAVRLRQILVERFDDEELKTLSYDLGVDYGDLRGTTAAAKARELVGYLERRNQLQDLVQLGKLRRPHVAWPEVSELRTPAS